ncbi:MAG: PadR family transcriptional regulator [Allosphingosinicella sp.]|uniref:PadR family transcriptional regulator n=1 Tax=Allosphingosinicella sp. TaxID=2823234 RepID=UPI003926BCB5
MGSTGSGTGGKAEKARGGRRGNAELTDNEGALLALIQRIQPATAYQIAKFYEAAPVHSFNAAKGKLYPLLYRLQERGLLGSEAVARDQRGTQLFTCAPAGEAALRNWTRSIRADHDLLHDPLRKKVQAFELLDQAERIAWIEDARALLQAKLARILIYGAHEEGRWGPLLADSARTATEARLAWLDRLQEEVLSDGRPA